MGLTMGEYDQIWSLFTPPSGMVPRSLEGGTAAQQAHQALHSPSLTASPAAKSGGGNPLKRQLSYDSQKDGHRRVEQNRRHDLTMLFNELASVLEARRPDGKGVPPKVSCGAFGHGK